MGFWSWLFGNSKEVSSPKVTQTYRFDPRDVLSFDEEWVVPEEWFIDTDGKRVRKKRRVVVDSCCGCSCEESIVDVSSNIVEEVIDAVTSTVVSTDSDSNTDVPLDGGNGNGDNPGYVDLDTPPSDFSSSSSDSGSSGGSSSSDWSSSGGSSSSSSSDWSSGSSFDFGSGGSFD